MYALISCESKHDTFVFNQTIRTNMQVKNIRRLIQLFKMPLLCDNCAVCCIRKMTWIAATQHSWSLKSIHIILTMDKFLLVMQPSKYITSNIPSGTSLRTFLLSHGKKNAIGITINSRMHIRFNTRKGCKNICKFAGSYVLP